MRKKLQRVIVWVAIIIALLVGWKVYEEYRFQQAYHRAMELLGEP